MEPSVASMKVDNSTGYFNQDLSKIPVKILGGYGGVNVELFRGFLRKDSTTVKNKEVNLIAESYIQVFKKEIINKEVLLNYRIEEIVERACQETITDGTVYEIYQTGIVIPVCDLSEFTLWSDLLKLLQESCLCVLVYEDQKVKFREFYSDTEVSQYDFTVENIEDLTIQKSNDTVKNSIIINSEFKSICPKTTISDNYVNIQEIKNELYNIIEGTNNKVYTTQKPLYKSEELVDGVYQYTTDNSIYIVSGSDFGVKVNIIDIDIINGIITIDRNLAAGTIISSNYQYQTMTLLPNQQREYIIELNESATDLQILCSAHKNVSAYDQGTPVSFSTIEAIDTVHLVNTIEKKDNKIKFTLKNNTTEVVTLSTLQIAGRPLKSFSPIKAKFINQPSITKYGEKPHEVNNNFIISEDQALILGKFLWQNISNEPVKKITIPAMNLLGFVQIGKVTVTESSTGTTGNYLVSNIKHNMQLNDWNSSCEVIPYPSTVSELNAEWLGKTPSNEYLQNTLFIDKIPNPVANLDVKYNDNLDGTKNIALMWQYINSDDNPIDGYEIFINVSSTSGTYTPDYQEDIVFTVRPEQRGLIIRNVPLKETIDSVDYYKYYAFAIRPYRNVHPTLNSEKTKYFSGDGIENTFMVDFTPLVSQKETRTVKVDGVPKTENVDFTVTTETGSFVFVAGSIPPSGTNNIQIIYKHLYPDGYIKSDIQKFCDYSTIDTFILYVGDSIVKAITGPFENTSITTMGKIVNALEKDKKYASSLLFTDFKGISLEVDSVERALFGQRKYQKYGMQVNNESGNPIFTAGDLDDNTVGIDMSLENGGTKITSAGGFVSTRSDGKVRTIVNANDGIKIQKDILGVWTNQLSADTDGNLELEGKLKAGIIQAEVLIAGTLADSISKTPATAIVADESTSLNVKRADFVVPIGSTSAEDTINAAINSLGTTGGKIVLLEGTFIVDGSIMIPSNVTLEGQGANTVIKIKNGLDTFAMGVIKNSGSINIKISNFKIDGNNANTIGPQEGVYLIGVSNSSVNSLHIVNHTGDGIWLHSSNNNSITGNTCQGNNYNIRIQSSNNNTITGNTCLDNNSFGIYLSLSSNNAIANNVCKNNGSGIYLLNGCNNNAITGNTCQGNNGDGITLSGLLNGCNNNAITGNTCQENNYYGISLNTGCINNSVSGNVCTENSQLINNNYTNIALFDNSDYNTIINNTCRKGYKSNSPYCGIYIGTSDCDGNLINGNDCYSSGVSAGIIDAGTGSSFGAGNRVNNGSWSTTPS